ncbi:hypothetical protein Enr10x_53620 [Gimesia panareensis]|uniref:Uncharacterized protein n=1 Tax=Gimesia panareensis TaxID=2527978 RepID=A0A518AED5_9PLAN|nr:hypothetical protein Enr10x_53620 [Gimesia panareensis]QDU53085.1 hypothetical protein Pan110_54690 [Gimesia panareensis]
MPRRILSLFLIPLVLLTQSVTFGHSHTGNHPAGHDLRAHIHVSSPTADEKHGHSHAHGAHSHKHEGHSHSDHDKSDSSQVDFPFDHDSSAIYLNSTDLTSSSRSLLNTELLLSFHWNAIEAGALACSLLGSTPEWSRHDCAPTGAEPPLFLRHHAFLI